MSLTRQIAHNTIIQIIGKAISIALGLMVIALLTRYLGQEGFGQYSTIIAFLQFFGIMADFGFTLVTTQMMAEEETSDSDPPKDHSVLLSNLFTLRLLSALIFLGLAPLLVIFFPYPRLIKIGVALTTLSFLFIALNQILVGICQKRLEMPKVVIAETLGRIALLAGTILVIWQKGGLLSFMAMIVLASFLNFLFNFLFIKNLVQIKWQIDWQVYKKIIQKSWPLGAGIFFNLIYFKADTIILSLYRSSSEVGLYGAPYRVLEVLISLPMMFLGLILPNLTMSWRRKKKERFFSIFQKSFDFLIMMTLPLVIGTLFLAKPIMILVAGPAFTISGDILKILIFATGIIFISSLLGHLIVAINQQKTMIWGYLLVAFLSLIGYLVFIPRYSYWGAAGVTVFSEALLLAIAFFVVYKNTKIVPSFKILNQILPATTVMATVLYLLQGQNLFFLILAGMLSYFGTMYLFLKISKN